MCGYHELGLQVEGVEELDLARGVGPGIRQEAVVTDTNSRRLFSSQDSRRVADSVSSESGFRGLLDPYPDLESESGVLKNIKNFSGTSPQNNFTFFKT